MGRLHHKLVFPDRFLPHLGSSCPEEEPKRSVRHFVVHLEINKDKYLGLFQDCIRKRATYIDRKFPRRAGDFTRGGLTFRHVAQGDVSDINWLGQRQD